MRIPSNIQENDMIAAAAMLQHKGMEISAVDLYDALTAYRPTEPQKVRRRLTWSVSEVCQATGFSRSRILLMVKSRRLPAINVGTEERARYYFRPAAVEQCLASLESIRPTEEAAHE